MPPNVPVFYPVAWGGIMDTRLEDEDGVEAAAGPWFFTGVRTALVDEDREWSTAADVVR